MTSSSSNSWREYAITLGLAVLLAVFLRFFVWTAYRVPTGSMQPTLKPGDFIFASRLSYWGSLPRRGDVVVFSYPQQPDIIYVKRVIALPGDKVELKLGSLFLNGRSATYEQINKHEDNPDPENFTIQKEILPDHPQLVLKSNAKSSESFGPIVVPPNEVFVLGDNRDASEDSRHWGSVPVSSLKGRVKMIWLSLNPLEKRFGHRLPQVRWERIFKSVD